MIMIGFRLAAIYSPERPVELTGRYFKTFHLKDFVALGQALNEQEQALLNPRQSSSRIIGIVCLVV